MGLPGAVGLFFPDDEALALLRQRFLRCRVGRGDAECSQLISNVPGARDFHACRLEGQCECGILHHSTNRVANGGFSG